MGTRLFLTFFVEYKTVAETCQKKTAPQRSESSGHVSGEGQRQYTQPDGDLWVVVKYVLHPRNGVWGAGREIYTCPSAKCPTSRSAL